MAPLSAFQQPSFPASQEESAVQRSCLSRSQRAQKLDGTSVSTFQGDAERCSIIRMPAVVHGGAICFL
jgi:hypothetical protein